MALNATFLAELADRNVSVFTWVEIEGIPYAYGNQSKTSDWFSARDVDEQFLSVVPQLLEWPRGTDQQVAIFEGKANVGTAEILIGDRDGYMTTAHSSRRTDTQIRAGTWAKTDTGALSYTDPDGVDASLPASGYLWVDREVLYYESINTGANTITVPANGRGRLRTRAEAHAAGRSAAPYPLFLATRVVKVFMVLNNGTDASKVVRYGGEITDSRLDDSHNGYWLTISTIDKRLGGIVSGFRGVKKIFQNQVTGRLTRGLPDAHGVYLSDNPDDQVAYNGWHWGPDGIAWDDDCYNPPMNISYIYLGEEAWRKLYMERGVTEFIARVGYEFIRFHYTAPTVSTLCRIEARGLFGSQIQQHHTGATWHEVFLIAKYNASDPALCLSSFTSDNAIDVALQLMVSTGRGDNNPSSGTYDTLPVGCGAEIPHDRINFTAIETLRDTYYSGARVAGVIEEPFDLRDFLTAEILAPLGAYCVATLDDQYEFKRLGVSMPDDSVTAIDSSKKLGRPSWQSGIKEIVGRVIYRTDFDPIQDDYMGVKDQEYTDAQEFYDQYFKTIEYKSRVLRFERGVISGTPLVLGNIDYRDERIDFFSRFAKPVPIVEVKCDYTYMAIDIGSLVTFTDATVPTVSANSRGVTAARAIVTAKHVDDLRGEVTLTLLLFEEGADNARRISPCAVVDSWDADNKVITVKVNQFSLAALSETDTTAFVAGGDGAGDQVVVCRPTLLTVSGAVRVTAKTTTTLTLSGTPSGLTPTADDIVMFAGYDTPQTANQKAVFATMADTSGKLGAANDSGHTYI